MNIRFQHPRSEWLPPSRAITGPAIDWSQIDTVVIHYTADDDLIDGDPGEHADQLDDYLRAINTSYWNGRGYAIGYNVAVDWLGGDWELRGDDIKCAANRGHNDHTWAILVLVDGADPATDLAVAKVRSLVAQAEARAGRPLKIVGHQQLAGAATGCPGVGLRGQIDAGVFRPPVPMPEEREDLMRQIIVNDGDPAVFLQDGLFVTWVSSEQVRDAVAASGVGPPVQVDRRVLKALELRGPAPMYAPGDTRPKTTSAHFARHES